MQRPAGGRQSQVLRVGMCSRPHVAPARPPGPCAPPPRLIYYITLCNGIVLAYFVAAISPNLDVANALLPT